MTREERAVRRALLCYPRAFRHERGEEVVSTVLETARDGRAPRAELWSLAWRGIAHRVARPLPSSRRSRLAGSLVLVAGVLLAMAAALPSRFWSTHRFRIEHGHHAVVIGMGPAPSARALLGAVAALVVVSGLARSRSLRITPTCAASLAGAVFAIAFAELSRRYYTPDMAAIGLRRSWWVGLAVLLVLVLVTATAWRIPRTRPRSSRIRATSLVASALALLPVVLIFGVHSPQANSLTLDHPVVLYVPGPAVGCVVLAVLVLLLVAIAGSDVPVSEQESSGAIA